MKHGHFPKLAAGSALGTILFGASTASAALITNPDDPRNWQGATVGTFAQLFYGANNAATRQLVIDNQLLDDGIFSSSTATSAALIQGGFTTGRSTDTTGIGGYDYVIPGGTQAEAGSSIDSLWVQTGNKIGDAIWDLGASATKAAIFNTIDHGPLPLEAIESTVYLSNDKQHWTQAKTQRVWLEGFQPILGILWDGFAYAVGTGTNEEFRYASIIWGGPGALQADGDNEINGVLGLDANFTPPPPPPAGVPIPAALPLLGSALAAFGILARKRRRA